MIRRMLLPAAAILLLATPALAQDPPISPPSQTEPVPSQNPPFTTGSPVVAVDGAALGVLEHVETNAAGQATLHIRAADGTLKAAPGGDASVRNGTVTLSWTRAEFEAAPPADDGMPPETPRPDPDNPPVEPDQPIPPLS